MEVWLLRHGDAEDENPAHPGDDAARRLTGKGEAQAEAAAAALVALGRSFDAVITSPRVRARETAAPVAVALGVGLEVHEPLHGGFGVGGLTALLRERGQAGRLLLVGHEPDFSELAEAVTGGRVRMKKGGIAAVDLDAGELIALLRPGELRAMG